MIQGIKKIYKNYTLTEDRILATTIFFVLPNSSEDSNFFERRKNMSSFIKFLSLTKSHIMFVDVSEVMKFISNFISELKQVFFLVSTNFVF